MLNKFIKIFYGLIAVSFVLVLPGRVAAYYQVSGIVAFTYRNYETRTGNNVSSSQEWIQDYRVNAGGTIWDPRVLQFYGGVGYSVYTPVGAQESNTLSYNLNTIFFPTLRVSWNLFGSRSITNVESSRTIAGSDITSTTYGGTLFLRLNRNGNNSNNVNNNFGRTPLVLPDITLSRTHAEAEGLNQAGDLHETRDDTRASVIYRPTAGFSLNLDGGMEQYENLVSGESYDNKTANLASDIRVSSSANLKLSGGYGERETDMPGFDSTYKTWSYGASLTFAERNGLSHSYGYGFNQQDSGNATYSTHSAAAQAVYRIIEEISMNGTVNYGLSEYETKPGPANPVGQKSTMETVAGQVGANYRKKYTPSFMGPFGFDTGYAFGLGYSKVTTEDGNEQGGGLNYTNNVDLGIFSAGLSKENLSLYYNFNNRQDDSPLHNDSQQQSYRLSASTARIPRTSINGSASYTSQESKSSAENVFLPTQPSTSQQRRTFSYNLNIDHTASLYLTLSAGAIRAKTSTQTEFTLSTQVPTKSGVQTEDTLYYGSANFTYPITRNLDYRAQFREEYRSAQTLRTISRQLSMNLDYRIRRIFVNLEYRLREDIPEDSDKTVQQYFFAKLSRPF